MYKRQDDKSVIERDLRASIEVLSNDEFVIESMVFTKNQIRHKDILAKCGIRAYRGPYIEKYTRYNRRLRKVLQAIDSFLPTSPKLVKARIINNDLVEIPGSMLYRKGHYGMRKYQSLNILTQKVISGLNKAAKDKGILHIWFHPYNFGYRTREHISGLSKILSHARELEDKGLIDISTMGEMARRLRLDSKTSNSKIE